MSKLKQVKSLIDKLFLAEEGDTSANEFMVVKTKDGVELSMKSKELDSEVLIGEAVAEDGEYTLEDDSILVVTEGKISEIKEATDLEEDPVVEPVPTTEPKQEEPKLEDAFNLEGLAKIVDVSKMVDGYISISANVIEGKLVWGDVYTTDYKTLLSEQGTEVQAKEAEISRLNSVITALSAESPQTTLLQAPTAVEAKPMTRVEALRERLG